MENTTESRAHDCPAHGYRMIPVHAVENGQRKVVGLTCPEPYCDFTRMMSLEERLALEGEGAGRLTGLMQAEPHRRIG
jgi:hypothetical protein